MKKLAICVPTYNRSNMINEVYKKFLPILDKLHIDVYIYDSSENDNTKIVVRDLQNLYNNLYYICMPSDMPSNVKVYKIFQKYGWKDDYEYIWMLADYFCCSDQFIIKLFNTLDNNFDMFVINITDFENIGNKIYTDAKDLFHDNAWYITQYGSTILKYDTMLRDVDWDYFQYKYLQKKYINFSHICFYFEKILKLETFRCMYFAVDEKDRFISTYRVGLSDYFNQFFHIWGYCWPKSIHALPDYYKNKNKAIKKLSIFTGNLGKNNLCQLRKDNILNPTIFWNYIFRWNYISTTSIFEFWQISHLPIKYVDIISHYSTLTNYVINKLNYYKLILFCKFHKNIYIYGAGKVANRYAGYLDAMKINYNGFVVTLAQYNDRMLKNHKILELDDLDLKNVGIVVAVNSSNMEEVIPLLESKGIKKNIYAKYIIP